MIVRNTIQCSSVLKAVNELQRHVTADEVYEEIVKKNPSISKGTVYRNLTRLSKMGRIRKIEVPDGPDRFDHRCSEHYHVQCIKCARVFDVDMAYMSNLESSIQDKHGFEFTGHDIFFKGICPDCQLHS